MQSGVAASPDSRMQRNAPSNWTETCPLVGVSQSHRFPLSDHHGSPWLAVCSNGNTEMGVQLCLRSGRGPFTDHAASLHTLQLDVMRSPCLLRGELASRAQTIPYASVCTAFLLKRTELSFVTTLLGRFGCTSGLWVLAEEAKRAGLCSVVLEEARLTLNYLRD